jgi:hypothetical protein
MCFYGDAGTSPCITNLSQDSLVKSACKTFQLFQNEVIVHFLFGFIIEILTTVALWKSPTIVIVLIYCFISYLFIMIASCIALVVQVSDVRKKS